MHLLPVYALKVLKQTRLDDNRENDRGRLCVCMCGLEELAATFLIDH